ncbi:MAG: transcriptional regulator [Fuerstiella sp.]|nr:transcriptional regulator [Fuerstiella sp.]
MAGIDGRDRELLEHLHRVGGADIQSLCDVLQITRTAVRARIQRLRSGGMLAVEAQSAGRGRPRQIYRINAEGMHALGEDYRQLAVVFWQVISEIDDEPLRNRLLARVRDRLAERFLRPLPVGGTVRERLDELADQMKSSGFNIESDHSAGLPILRETNCPFPMLADVDDSICQVEKEVMEQVLGVDVEFVNRCRDGYHCCEFQVKS